MVFRKDDQKTRAHPGSPCPPTDEAYVRELEECIRETSAAFGGIEILDAKFDRYLRAAKLLDESRPALRGKYPDQWVSMDESGNLTVANTHQELIDALAANGLFSGDFPVAHLNTKPRRWAF